MRLVINAASAHTGGAFTYVAGLLRGIRAVSPDTEVLAFVPEATQLALENDFRGSNINLSAFPFQSTGGVSRWLFDQILLPNRIRRFGGEALLSSTGFATIAPGVQQIVLVRNALYFQRRPGLHLRSFSAALRYWWARQSVTVADQLLFPTNHMRELVLDAIPASPDRSHVLHYGFDENMFITSRGRTSGTHEEIRSFKGNGNSIVLLVASYAKHKNIETAVRALALLKRRGLPVKLITTLDEDHTAEKGSYAKLLTQIQSSGLADEVMNVGYVSYPELSLLYASADLFLFPSVFESFGHPLVEAMASGLPVAAADRPYSREVCGNAALYFDSRNAEECADTVERIINNPSVSESMSWASSTQARSFSWTRYAERLLQLLD